MIGAHATMPMLTRAFLLALSTTPVRTWQPSPISCGARSFRAVSPHMNEGADDFDVGQVAPPSVGPGMSPCTIKVVGVGGGGGNTLNRMVQEGPGVERSAFLEYVACNTDVQALTASLGDTTIQLGKNSARGLGAGGIPAVGRASAIDAAAEIETLVRGVDMVFVTAGMGGGTGSGAAPVVAELAKQAGCLTVGIVTKPFSFEGRRRMQQATDAIEELQAHVDILIVVSNDKLLEIVPEGVPLQVCPPPPGGGHNAKSFLSSPQK